MPRINNTATFVAKVTEWQGRKQYTPLTTNEFGEVETGIGSYFCPGHEITADIGQFVVVRALFSVGMRQSQTLVNDKGASGWHETSRFVVKETSEFDTLDDATAALDHYLGVNA